MKLFTPTQFGIRLMTDSCELRFLFFFSEEFDLEANPTSSSAKWKRDVGKVRRVDLGNRSSDQFIPFGSSDFVPWLVPVVLAYPLAVSRVLCCSFMSVRPIPLCHSFKHSVQGRAWVLGAHSCAVSAGALHPCPLWGCGSASFQTSVCV